eukprot:4950996-Alexandrium_andersonii.AAC.1
MPDPAQDARKIAEHCHLLHHSAAQHIASCVEVNQQHGRAFVAHRTHGAQHLCPGQPQALIHHPLKVTARELAASATGQRARGKAPPRQAQTPMVPALLSMLLEHGRVAGARFDPRAHVLVKAA